MSGGALPSATMASIWRSDMGSSLCAFPYRRPERVRPAERFPVAPRFAPAARAPPAGRLTLRALDLALDLDRVLVERGMSSCYSTTVCRLRTPTGRVSYDGHHRSAKCKEGPMRGGNQRKRCERYASTQGCTHISSQRPRTVVVSKGDLSFFKKREEKCACMHACQPPHSNGMHGMYNVPVRTRSISDARSPSKTHAHARLAQRATENQASP